MATALDVITRVRDLINDVPSAFVSGVRWTDAEILRWITDAQRELVKRKPEAYPRTQLFTVVPGQPRQQLDPSTAYRLIRVEANSNASSLGEGTPADPPTLLAESAWLHDNALPSGPTRTFVTGLNTNDPHGLVVVEMYIFTRDLATPVVISGLTFGGQAMAVQQRVATLPPGAGAAHHLIAMLPFSGASPAGGDVVVSFTNPFLFGTALCHAKVFGGVRPEDANFSYSLEFAQATGALNLQTPLAFPPIAVAANDLVLSSAYLTVFSSPGVPIINLFSPAAPDEEGNRTTSNGSSFVTIAADMHVVITAPDASYDVEWRIAPGADPTAAEIGGFVWSVRGIESEDPAPGPPEYGDVIRIVERDVLDSFAPRWTKQSGRTSAPDFYRHYTMDAEDPLAFWLWPRPVVDRNVYVTFAGIPPDVPATGSTLALADTYIDPLVDYTAHRALLKESRAGLKDAANAFLISFLNKIGAQREVLKLLGQNASRPPEAEA